MNVCSPYRSYNLALADESGSDAENDGQKFKSKKQVVKSSFASAFQSIISKKVDESAAARASNVVGSEGPILAKYKRPAKEVTEEKKKEQELKQKKLEKERLRIMGRTIPTAEDEPKERELQIVATKGGN